LRSVCVTTMPRYHGMKKKGAKGPPNGNVGIYSVEIHSYLPIATTAVVL